MRIHTSMGALIDTAMPSRWIGRGSCMTPGTAMNASMPRSIAIHISA
jgi:hypothetical protein